MDKENIKYLVIIEQADDGSYGAYVPDLSGCGVCGMDSIAKAKESIRQAIAMHLAGLRADGEAIPAPQAQAELVSPTAA